MTLPVPTSLYLFDRTGQDTMGVNDLTANGTPTYTSGIIDYAAVLNGSSQYFQAGNNTVFDVTTSDFSLWGYFYRTSDSGTSEFIASKRSGTGVGYAILINSSDKLYAEIVDAGGNANVSTTSSISTNTWYFCVASYSRSGSLNVYLYNMSSGAYENVSVSISSRSLTLTNTTTFTVGRDSLNNDSWFPGRIDHLNVLLGTAITQQQFLDLVQTPRIAIHRRDKTDNSTVTYYEARNFNGISIRGQNPLEAIGDIAQTDKDAQLVKIVGPTLQITADWTIIDEDSTVVFDDTNGSVTYAGKIYPYLFDSLWATGSTQITAEHTLTFYNGNDRSFVRTGGISGIDIMQTSDQPLTYRANLQFQVGSV